MTPLQRSRRIAHIEAELILLRLDTRHPRGRLALSKALAAMAELRMSLTEQLADDMLDEARGTYHPADSARAERAERVTLAPHDLVIVDDRVRSVRRGA